MEREPSSEEDRERNALVVKEWHEMMDAMLQSARKVRDEYLRDLFTFDATLIKLTHDETGNCLIKPCPQHSRLLFQEYCEEACDFTGFEDEDIRRPANFYGKG